MNAALVVGFSRFDGADRQRIRHWIVTRYEHAGWLPILGVCQRQRWVKACAFNRAVDRTDANVVVAADADSFVTDAALRAAVAAAARFGWAIPANTVRRIDQAATAVLLAAEPVDAPPLSTPHRHHELLRGGGIVVVRRDVWDAVGGFDPRFAGWGGEDAALGHALRAMTGHQAPKPAGTLWHLWHEPQQADMFIRRDNERLAQRYRAAQFDRATMTDLIDEWRHPR